MFAAQKGNQIYCILAMVLKYIQYGYVDPKPEILNPKP